MNNNSDPLFTQYADLNFADAKPVAAVPALAQLQAAQGGKSRITMRVDTAVIAAFNLKPGIAHAKAPSSPRNTIG
ncbi:hypothetical protein [uncultured Thiodictyon sp.]|uniref:hypothetical protein n=1 Tax=uncultured Thiodictyon sp. TaxID=1846217 RepID=UPI0025D9E12D|nr:hypothetical protein [uncultured Thiodictyon sp.]